MPSPAAAAPPFPLLSFPNELLVAIAEHLPTLRDLHSLFLTTRRLSSLLAAVLHNYAASTSHALPALYWAIATGNAPMARLVLDKSRQALIIRSPSFTILHRTPSSSPSSSSPLPITQDALSTIFSHRGAIVVHEEATGTTALHWAARRRLPNLVSRLLDLGASVDAQDAGARTPLHLSLMTPAFPPHDCARILVQRGASMSARENVSGHSPLHYAATTVRVEELRALLDSAVGLSFGVADANGQTPLHWAAAMGKAGAVEVLLKRGANVAVRDGRGMTPLHVVARHPYARRLEGKYETVAWLLIRRGADGTIRDRSGNRVVDLLEGRWGGVRGELDG